MESMAAPAVEDLGTASLARDQRPVRIWLFAVAALIYRVETAPFPLRIDDAELQPRTDGGGNDLQLHLTLSTLCRAARPQPGEDGRVPAHNAR